MSERLKTVPTVSIHDPKNPGDFVLINASDFIPGLHILSTEKRPAKLHPINTTKEEFARLTAKKETPEEVAKRAFETKSEEDNAANDDSRDRVGKQPKSKTRRTRI